MFLVSRRLAVFSCRRCFCSSSGNRTEEPVEYWKDPWKHAREERTEEFTGYKKSAVDWSCVERLMPHEVIPDVPKHCSYPTPSGWRPPKNPPPDLPYFIRRHRNHLPALYLECRRNQLNLKTMDFDYVELVKLRNVSGDVFACERDLRDYLEHRLNNAPIATHVDELKGQIRIRGADRSIIEQFVLDSGF